MSLPAFLEIDHVDRMFPTPQGTYVALKDVHLRIAKGEFISVIGHSGCGKSTLLNIVAGLDRASAGGIVLQGREVRDPGPDRMVVFQNHSLLPWLTVRQNIALGVNRVLKHLSKQERRQVVADHIAMVGLTAAADKYPREISGGMKQRVGIARALAIRPELLLLDEPFGALDALTRGRLQEQLMEICNRYEISAMMVTHDVDEALLLADRVIMMTNGPSAHIGQILAVPLPRPRSRMEVIHDPNYYRLRGELVEFLNHQKFLKKERAKVQKAAVISRGSIEKSNLTLGFIPLSDCAPLVVAVEKGFFAKHGLDVTLTREPSWSAIADGMREGQLDAAQMVTGMPLSLTLGADNHPPLPMQVSMTLSRNGNAITLSRRLYDQGVTDLSTLRLYLQTLDRKRLPTMGVVHAASMHNFLLRHWLSSGGIQPDRDVELMVIPPPQMLANLTSGGILGYCVGEPWNMRAVQERLGFVVIATMDLWSGHIEKVLGVRQEWAEQYPNTYLALTKALLEACLYCESFEHRDEIAATLAGSRYLNADSQFIRPGLAGPYDLGTGKTLYRKEFCRFDHNTPHYSEHLWVLAQMVRWHIVPLPSNYDALLRQMLSLSVYQRAVAELDLPPCSDSMTPITLWDGTTFDPTLPLSA
ncbi:MAG: ABC transporter substrate-binding protein [Oscillatoriales cyanobacterium SM2_2_1]|nr:ABC transporter substrate-binding protein [Oscillatoriales cyanobacterium SM2_2_1]